MSITSKLINQVAKPAIVGAMAYAGSMSLYSNQSINILGMNLNNHLAYELLGVGSSFVAEIGHNFILSYIPGN